MHELKKIKYNYLNVSNIYFKFNIWIDQNVTIKSLNYTNNHSRAMYLIYKSKKNTKFPLIYLWNVETVKYFKRRVDRL